VARVDLSDGLYSLAINYQQLALEPFTIVDAVQCTVMALVIAVSFLYAFFMFRPFVSATFAGVLSAKVVPMLHAASFYCSQCLHGSLMPASEEIQLLNCIGGSFY
jgi:hypothetical protein